MPKTTTASMKERLAQERNIWISTVRPDGRPHIVPVWFVSVDKRIYVCIEPQSVKGRNLAANHTSPWRSRTAIIQLFAKVRGGFFERPWPEPVVGAFRDKYDWSISSEQQYTALFEITPRKWLKW